MFMITGVINAQHVVTGKVTDTKGELIEGANVFLEGTYDGGTTTNKGTFNFETTEKGIQKLVISYLGFETYSLSSNISKMTDLVIKLREEINSLNGVTLTAGTFEAGDNAKVSVLKPLDVVTTAGALGDFVGALQTLPGTSTVAEDGRLFVRGGDAEETQIFIDGIRVFTPFAPSTNNIPTRGRYSPFLFKGMAFSTGGYSAEYGQALSSVLLLSSVDEPDQEKTDISIMSVGAGLGNTQIWGKSSLSVNTSYINLAPYQALFNDRNTWHKPFETFSGEAVYRYKLAKGIIKLYTALDTSSFDLTQEDINFKDGVHFKLKNSNFYMNTSYKGFFGNGWSLRSGLSYTYGKTGVTQHLDDIDTKENSYHVKVTAKKNFSSRFKLNFGVEHFLSQFNEDYYGETGFDFNSKVNTNISAAFAEADIYFSDKFASKVGLRTEYSALQKEYTVSPRVSLAYKVSENGQFSFAYGDFYQSPSNTYLRYNEDLNSEKAAHYIFNYQHITDGRIFRAETYYKKYDDLIKYNTQYVIPTSNLSNAGDGFASGLDLFWRDSKTFKKLDYWLSYSFLETERNYKNYPTTAKPRFGAKHNLSVVSKYWVEKWRSQLGLSYSFASGRSYTNPNTGGFLTEKTKTYNNLSFNWAYLISQQKILYFSVNNILGFKNINGYQYSDIPDVNGDFGRRALTPAADQFFFIGFFWTISDDKNSNQLDKL